MATFTHLDDASIAALARAFDLGPVCAWGAIEAGTVNSNFVVDTARGRVFLRVNEGKTVQDVRYEADLVTALVAAGVTAPVPLLSGDTPFAVWGEHYVTVFPWVAGVHRCQAGVSASDAYYMGAALAGLHCAGQPLAEHFDRDGIYTFDHIVARFDAICAKDDPELSTAVALVGEEIAWLRARSDLRSVAPRGVIHADLFRDNVLFDERGRIAALLDFEQACVGSLTYDLAVLINAWCYGDDVVSELVAAIVAGYQSVRPLAATECRALIVECRAAAMRFAVTRITDVHLRDTPSTKDFRRCLARLSRWRQLGPQGLAAAAGLE